MNCSTRWICGGVVVLSAVCVTNAAVIWDSSVPPDPCLWPYGDTNDFIEIPTPETQPTVCYVYRPSAVQANQRVYIVGGRMSSAPTGYVNAHSHLSIFNPFESNPSNMWQAAKWDGSGPCGINMGVGTTWPIRPNGVAPAGVALGTYDVDFDGTEELFLFSGENHPGNTVMMYDPDGDSWTNRTGTSGIVNVTTCAGGQVGGKYYLHGAPDSMFVYDFLADSWQTVPIANFPQKTVQGGSASDEQKIYMPWGAYDDITRTSSNSFGLSMYIYDPATPSNVVAGVPPPFGCNQAAVVAYRDRVYLFGGRITGGADSSTNLIQVYFVASNSWYISQDRMPANINAPAAWFANRRVVIANGYLFNNGAQPNQTTNVLWSADIRQLDPPFPTALDVFPGTLDLGMTASTGVYYVGDAGGIGLDYTNIVTAPWLAVTPAAGATAGLSYRTNTVVINRALITAPVTGTVQVVAGGGTSVVTVIAAPPMPLPFAIPNLVATLTQVSNISFKLLNAGTLALYFTNTATTGWITDITPATGVVSPAGGFVMISFNVGTVTPLPATGAVIVAGNAPSVQCTVVANSDTFYVSPSGNNANNGQNPGAAWRTLSHAFAAVPNGIAGRPVTLHAAAGTYANESSLPNTNLWSLHLNDRSNLRVLGAGAQQSIIVPGTNIWPLVRGESDRVPSRCPLELRNAVNLEFSGFTIVATNPPALTTTNTWDSFCVIVGIEQVNGLYLHHLYLDGSFTGAVYSTDDNVWSNEWQGWLYFGIAYRGLTGPNGARFENILLRGTQGAFRQNNFGFTGDDSNTGPVWITHCTFVEQCNPGGAAFGVGIHNPGDPHFAPSYLVEHNIFGDIPNALRPEATEAIGLTPDQLETSAGVPQMQAYSNQVWSIGVPVPGENWWNVNVIAEDNDGNTLNFTNEPPVFETLGGLPYSTQVETVFGTRDVGWNVVPEPMSMLFGLLALLGARAGRRQR